MKPVSWLKLMLFLAITLSVGVERPAQGYGVGECSVCHNNNKRNAGRVFHTGSDSECKECHLGKGPELIASDAGSTCLRCHEAPMGTRNPTGYFVSTNGGDLAGGNPPSQLTPGGDFGWLKKSYSWSSGTSPGERHGHNIIAVDYGFAEDRTLRFSPHGNYPSGELSCTSCHDPHAKSSRGGVSGAYRMLGGKGYKAAPGFFFAAEAPVAVSPPSYNRPESTTDTRVAYGTGMSEWCGNCHTGGCGGQTHPAGACATCSNEVLSNYNAYLKSGNINGSIDTAYTSLIPLEEGTTQRELLALHAQSNGSYTRGAEPRFNVSCLTCHRSHASGWNHLARWNMESDFIVYRGAYPGTDNGSPVGYAQGRTVAETRRALYERPPSRFASMQRSLCNKCHIRD